MKAATFDCGLSKWLILNAGSHSIHLLDPGTGFPLRHPSGMPISKSRSPNRGKFYQDLRNQSNEEAQ
jgi:hypothetical protein